MPALPTFLYGTAWKEDRTAALTELALTAGSAVMSHWLRVTTPPDACLRSAISSEDIAVPKTR